MTVQRAFLCGRVLAQRTQKRSGPFVNKLVVLDEKASGRGRIVAGGAFKQLGFDVDGRHVLLQVIFSRCHVIALLARGRFDLTNDKI